MSLDFLNKHRVLGDEVKCIVEGACVTTSDNEIYRLSDGVLSIPVEHESMLLEMGSEKYFGVRGAMRHHLEGLRGGLSLATMVADTCARYRVTPEAARQDLEAILRQLIAAGIIERSA